MNPDFPEPEIPDEVVHWPAFERAGWEVVIRREDLLHPKISGNKFRKLKYNLRQARDLGCHTLLTLGGAHSNHILAVAALAREHGLHALGWIRGDELRPDSNDTLSEAADLGMALRFVPRSLYAILRTRFSLLALSRSEGIPVELQGEWHRLWREIGPKLPGVYALPEGGTNRLAVYGCRETLRPGDEDFDRIACAVGTGGTLAGLASAAAAHQRVIGFSAVRGITDQRRDIAKFTPGTNWELTDDYALGGYGRVSDPLVDLINQFRACGNCLLDPVYTGKMLWGLTELARQGRWRRGSRILVIHTGGLQGIRGVNRERSRLGRQVIHIE